MNLQAWTLTHRVQSHVYSERCATSGIQHLIVTHDESIAKQCDAIRQMSDGRFIEEFTEEE